MIQKQQPTQSSSFEYDIPSFETIHSLLCVNYQSPMLNYRYFTKFMKFFGNLESPQTFYQFQAKEVLILSENEERMNRYFQIREIGPAIKNSIAKMEKFPIPVVSGSKSEIHLIKRIKAFNYLKNKNSNMTKNQNRQIKVQKYNKLLPTKISTFPTISNTIIETKKTINQNKKKSSKKSTVANSKTYQVFTNIEDSSRYLFQNFIQNIQNQNFSEIQLNSSNLQAYGLGRKIDMANKKVDDKKSLSKSKVKHKFENKKRSIEKHNESSKTKITNKQSLKTISKKQQTQNNALKKVLGKIQTSSQLLKFKWVQKDS